MKKVIFWSSSIVTLIVLTMGSYADRELDGGNGLLGYASSVVETVKNLFKGESMPQTSPTSPTSPTTPSPRLIESKIQALADAYQKEIDTLLEDFSMKINNEILDGAGFKKAEANIPLFVKRMTGYKFCGRLCAAMAHDKIKSTNRAEEMLAPLIQEYIADPCAQEEAVVTATLNDFLTRLQEIDNQYKAGLSELMDEGNFRMDSLELSDKLLVENTAKIDQKIRAYAEEKAWGILGSALEIAFAKSTYTAIKPLLMKVASKLAMSAGVTLTLGMADGPLPVGDIFGGIFATGMTAWTGYDIYKVTLKLPGILNDEMEQMISNFKNTLRTETLQKANSIIDECTRGFEASKKECLAVLKQE